jgi:hypothetical protein
LANDEFGTYGDAAVPEVELGDDFWDVEPNKPSIPEGEMIFYIEGYEAKYGSNKPSFGYNFTLVPYQDAYGIPVDATVSAIKLKKYFYVGKVNKETNKLYEVAQGNRFQTFLSSIGIGKTAEGKFPLNQENVRGKLVRGTVEWTKSVSTRENPNTGIVPTEIDDNDPYSYVVFAGLKDDLRGVRGNDGEVQKVNI